MYLKEIGIKDDFRCLIKDTKIELQPITLLVGEQGTGKSTLLELIQRNEINYKLTELGEKGVETFYFDSERMNPRIQDIDDFTNPNGTNKGVGLAYGLMTRFKSHGETLREYTVDRIKDAENCILILDEPEAALSLSNQYKLVDEFKKAIDRNVQLIVATHCLPVIQSFNNVFSMETMEWVGSKEYIEKMKKG